jgi:hypothetical protein
MKNGLNNLFTAHLVPELSGILYFCVMTSLVVLKMGAKRRKSKISEVIQRN